MNLLLTGAWASAQAHIPSVKALGHRVAYLPQERDPLPCDPEWVEGAVCNGLLLHHPIDCFPRLRYLQLTSAGLDRVPLRTIRERGIVLHSARGVYSIPMAEHALGAVLALYRQTRRFLAQQQAAVWEKHRDLRELYGKRVTVLGCGSVGTECARRFAAFGCSVTGIDAIPPTDAAYAAALPPEALNGVLRETDVLILTLPLTPQTRGLVDAACLARLPEGAILVNLARGGLVDQAALIDALRGGRLSGAVLDVFEQEPLAPDCPLWGMEQVLLTPHNSFVGEGNEARLSALILEHLREAAQ